MYDLKPAYKQAINYAEIKVSVAEPAMYDLKQRRKGATPPPTRFQLLNQQCMI